jgi:hypothetical protein
MGGGGAVIYPNVMCVAYGCVFDQHGVDCEFTDVGANAGVNIIGCELFSSVAAAAGTYAGIVIGNQGGAVVDCNIHDLRSGGIKSLYAGTTIVGNIVAKCGSTGISIDNNQGFRTGAQLVANNTVDGNAGHGIEVGSQFGLFNQSLYNNIISNHVTAGKYGITIDAGTAATNDVVKQFVDYNVFYNNAADTNLISYGPHDTHGGTDPYVNAATENYTLR